MSDADNPNELGKPSQRFFTPLQRALLDEEDRVQARAKLLDKQNDGSAAGSDKLLPAISQHNYDSSWIAKKKNFDEKMYLLPASFNALRRELNDHWPTFFNSVDPRTGGSLGYCMAFDAPQFIGIMNEGFDLAVQMDSENIDGICKTFLNAARMKRGLRPFTDDNEVL